MRSAACSALCPGGMSTAASARVREERQPCGRKVSRWVGAGMFTQGRACGSGWRRCQPRRLPQACAGLQMCAGSSRPGPRPAHRGALSKAAAGGPGGRLAPACCWLGAPARPAEARRARPERPVPPPPAPGSARKSQGPAARGGPSLGSTLRRGCRAGVLCEPPEGAIREEQPRGSTLAPLSGGSHQGP